MGVAIVGTTGCFGAVAYPCEGDEQCQLDGRMGACEAEGYCSLPDDDCDSRRRFSEHAPAELAGTCVEPGGTQTDSDGSDSGPDDTGSTCEGEGCGCAVHLAVAFDRSCVIDDQARLWCWGANDQGELGDPSQTQDVEAPQEVSLPGSVLDVALDAHACARTSEGVWCWGPDQQGQVSIEGAASMAEAVAGPTMPDDLRLGDAEAIAAGERWSCALVGSGRQLLCWGELEHVDGTGPTWLAELGGSAAELVMTRRSVCARMDDGSVRCAGSNAGGELGVPVATQPSAAEPVAVPSVPQAMEMAAAVDLYCARTTQAVWCWGYDQEGEAGGTSTGGVVGPTRVDLQSDGLGLGMRTSCATQGGVPWCWGRALPGITAPSSATPAAQDWLASAVDGAIVEIGLGTAHVCVRTDRGQVWCWGSNDRGQVGIPGSDGAAPAQVSLPCDP